MAAATAMVKKEGERDAPDEREFLIQKTKARRCPKGSGVQCAGAVDSDEGDS